MRNKKKSQISVLLLILLGLSIGFAALATTLKINGSATITKNTWNIYWDNIANQDVVTPTTSEIVSEDANHPNNIVTFEVTFDKPGDYYEFTVDAVNAGTLDAEIIGIEKKYNDTVIPEEEDPNNRVVPTYLKYEVTYADGSAIAIGNKLAKAPNPTAVPPVYTTKTYKIRVEYDKDAVTNADINNQVGNVTHEFSFKVDYGQATPSGDEEDDSAIAARIAEIEADPDEYRNADQSVSNPDIGLDENGNVINLDLWKSESDYCSHHVTTSPNWGDGDSLMDNKAYSKRVVYNDQGIGTEVNEITLGAPGCHTLATASESIVNGEMTNPIPAYILLDGEDHFYPVTETIYTFALYDYVEQPITKFPNLPKTVKVIGEDTFHYLGMFENVEIPKRITEIGSSAFNGAYASGENNTLTFENGSKLVKIDNHAFAGNYLNGTIELPSLVRYIGKDAFSDNSDLNTVRVPTAAEYFTNCTWPDSSDSCDSFDEGVTLIRY